MYFLERKNGIRDSDGKSAGCGIPVKKERECGIRTPLPDHVLKEKYEATLEFPEEWGFKPTNRL